MLNSVNNSKLISPFVLFKRKWSATESFKHSKNEPHLVFQNKQNRNITFLVCKHEL